ncbi:MAG: hypothetical protein ACTSUO_05700 [Candidatus Thorarchaeota archaeon]
MDKKMSTDTIKYLLGGIGLQTLSMISQGCLNNGDITALSLITEGCLEVKIPLLITLGLITAKSGEYKITTLGKRTLSEVVGWHV